MARTSNLASLSFTDLQAELRRREKGSSTLLRKRERLLAKLHALDAQIGQLGVRVNGNGAVGGRTRPRNEMNLVDALAKVLDGKSMSVTDVSEAVQKAGYQTTSPSFRTIVNQTLINSGKFKRVECGVYTAK
jgi:hypothetical protein